MFKRVLTLIFALSLTGCADLYKTPDIAQNGGQPLATIRGSYDSKSLYNWQQALVLSVDNKSISYFMKDLTASQPSKNIIAVTSNKPHTFIISVDFNEKFLGGGPYQGLVDINTTLQPGKHYQVKGAVDGIHIKAWIVDEAGKSVTPVATAVYAHQRNETVIVVR